MWRKLYWALCLLIHGVSQSSTTSNGDEVVLTTEEKGYVFIADDIFQGIIPRLNECWNTLLAALEHGELLNIEYEKQGFWNDILLKRLKPYHQSIREIDKAVLGNIPSKILNNAVNITTMPSAFHLSEQTIMNKSVDWLDIVKDGWIKVAGMMAQLHFKYDWTLDHIYNEGRSTHVGEDLSALNSSMKQYFLWYNIRNLENEPELYNSTHLVNISKQMASGELLPAKTESKNLFLGLKELLQLEGIRLSLPIDQQLDPDAECTGNETIAGKRRRVFRYIPVYVLLHLLNGEFKYYVMQNIAEMYRCVQTKKCDRNASTSSNEHLRTFYRFYFDGIVDAFREKKKETTPVSSIPSAAWRWRCDPKGHPVPDVRTPLNHVEDVTFTRFYDFETVFVAEEREISVTNTCRDSCDIFDGGYTSVPCKDNDTICIEQQKNDFDCNEAMRQGSICPRPTRALCPNSGIKCTTIKMQKVQVCDGQRDWRHMEWLDSSEGNAMGKKTACSVTGMKNISSESITERAGITKFALENCEICLCKCYGPLSNRSHRYVSLLPQLAEIANHKALVGIKFVKINGVIYPKIAQASVKYGMPNASTIEWIDPSPVQDTSDPRSVFKLGRNAKNILLDDILAPTGYIVTGIRFVTVNYTIRGDYEINSSTILDSEGQGLSEKEQWWNFKPMEHELALEVQVTALTEMGDLKWDTVTWISNVQNTSLFRNQVIVDDPDEPTLTDLPSTTNSTSNQFVSIQSSSLKKDLGQTPVPFFDTQEIIEPHNLTLIRGLGIFYKTRPGFGGFLAFRLLPMPISDAPWNPRYDLWHSILPEKLNN